MTTAWFVRKARGAMRRLAACAFAIHLAVRNRYSKAMVTGDEDALVSLTTYGARINLVHLTIESIARGSVLPRRFILWVDDARIISELPAQLARLASRGLEIKLTEDIGPHKKYFPALPVIEADGIARLVTADDDVMYPRDWLEALASASRQSKGAVVGHRVRRVTFLGRRVAPWAQWPLVDDCQPSLANMAIGEAGVAYPRNVIRSLIQRDTGFAIVAPRADDLWLHASALAIEAPTRQVRAKPLWPLVVPKSQVVSLAEGNILGGENDRQISATYTQGDLELLRRATDTH